MHKFEINQIVTLLSEQFAKNPRRMQILLKGQLVDENGTVDHIYLVSYLPKRGISGTINEFLFESQLAIIPDNKNEKTPTLV